MVLKLLPLAFTLLITSCVSTSKRETKIFSYDLDAFAQSEENSYVRAQHGYQEPATGAELFDPGAPKEPQLSLVSKATDTKKHLKITGPFEWPVQKARFVRGFNPYAKESERHFGLDLAAPRGTPVFAAKDGVVIYAGAGFTGYGKIVIIDHLNGQYATFYSHLDRITVAEGDSVTSKDEIGEVGSTGRSTGNHLHFEIRSITDGPLNPLDFLKK